jgi:hypothetical protein
VLRLGAAIGGAIGVLAAMAYVLRIDAFTESVNVVIRRLRRRAP